uniref:ENT domain-containing protein n=1 Tax=Rhabditophanes sp. KR3021 TaxID=114890 RepID=A0AC35UIN5_9BILA
MDNTKLRDALPESLLLSWPRSALMSIVRPFQQSSKMDILYGNQLIFCNSNFFEKSLLHVKNEVIFERRVEPIFAGSHPFFHVFHFTKIFYGILYIFQFPTITKNGLLFIRVIISYFFTLEEHAFQSCINAFRARGNINSYQFLILSHLKYIFSITTESARTYTRQAANDLKLISIATTLNSEVDVSSSWLKFGTNQTASDWLDFTKTKYPTFFKQTRECIEAINPDTIFKDINSNHSETILRRLLVIPPDSNNIPAKLKSFFMEIQETMTPPKVEEKKRDRPGRPKKSESKKETKVKIICPESPKKILQIIKEKSFPIEIVEKRKRKLSPENLRKKEMHTMICQRVIPISDNYKNKTLKKRMLIRKLNEKDDVRSENKDAFVIDSKELSCKITCPSPLKKIKLDNIMPSIPKLPIHDKTTSFEIRQPPFKFVRDNKSAFRTKPLSMIHFPRMNPIISNVVVPVNKVTPRQLPRLIINGNMTLQNPSNKSVIRTESTEKESSVSSTSSNVGDCNTKNAAVRLIPRIFRCTSAIPSVRFIKKDVSPVPADFSSTHQQLKVTQQRSLSNCAPNKDDESLQINVEQLTKLKCNDNCTPDSSTISITEQYCTSTKEEIIQINDYTQKTTLPRQQKNVEICSNVVNFGNKSEVNDKSIGDKNLNIVVTGNFNALTDTHILVDKDLHSKPETVSSTINIFTLNNLQIVDSKGGGNQDDASETSARIEGITNMTSPQTIVPDSTETCQILVRPVKNNQTRTETPSPDSNTISYNDLVLNSQVSHDSHYTLSSRENSVDNQINSLKHNIISTDETTDDLSLVTLSSSSPIDEVEDMSEENSFLVQNNVASTSF